MKSAFCLLPFLLTAPAFCADGSALLNLLPPDTQIVVGIHVHAVVDSGLVRSVTSEVQAEMQTDQADWQKLIAGAGFDPLHDVDEVLITSTGEGKQAPALIVAQGRFNAARQALHGETYNGVTLAAGKTGADGVYGFLDDSTALAGTAALVKAAIDRGSAAAPLSAALSTQLSEYRERYDIWGVINRTAGLAGYLPPSTQSSGLDSIDRLQFGIGLKHGLELTAEVHARSSKDGEQLASTLQFFQAMTRASQPASSGTKFDIQNSNGTIKIALSVSEEDLKKAIENQRKAGMWRAVSPAPRKAAPVRVQSAEGNRPPAPAPADGGTAVFTLPGAH